MLSFTDSGAGHSTSSASEVVSTSAVGSDTGGVCGASSGDCTGVSTLLAGGPCTFSAAAMNASFSAAAAAIAACSASRFALNLSAIKSALVSRISVSKSSPRRTLIIASSTKSIARLVNSLLDLQRLM